MATSDNVSYLLTRFMRDTNVRFATRFNVFGVHVLTCTKQRSCIVRFATQNNDANAVINYVFVTRKHTSKVPTIRGDFFCCLQQKKTPKHDRCNGGENDRVWST